MPVIIPRLNIRCHLVLGTSNHKQCLRRYGKASTEESLLPQVSALNFARNDWSRTVSSFKGQKQI